MLLLIGLPLIGAAFLRCAGHLLTLLRRTRWIMASLLLIYAYATPGEAVWASLAQFSPTIEGINDGLLQSGRLIFMLAGLSLLLSLLSQQQLISGLYTLCYPLQLIGLSRERLAVRLALTLHYAESALHNTSSSWRGNMEHMLAPPPVAQQMIELHTKPFTWRDGLLLLAGCMATALALL